MPRHSGAGPADRAAAAFDFDGTLTTGDTFVPFLLRMTGRTRTARALGGSARHWWSSGRDAAKASTVETALRGLRITDLEEVGAAYAEHVLRHRIRPLVRARLEEHQAAGHVTVVISASLTVYVSPVARRLGVDHVAATDLDVVDGRCTGRLLGFNCRGAEKVARLHRLLGGEPTELWAYGDSAGDRELLASATHACWVRRGVITGPPFDGVDAPGQR